MCGKGEEKGSKNNHKDSGTFAGLNGHGVLAVEHGGTSIAPMLRVTLFQKKELESLLSPKIAFCPTAVGQSAYIYEAAFRSTAVSQSTVLSKFKKALKTPILHYYVPKNLHSHNLHQLVRM